MPFKIVRNDITRMDTDAIVNTASETVGVGAGCDTAVYNAAGREKMLAYRRENVGRVPEGEAFITPGFNLPAKYVIHAVSPFYMDGKDGEEEKLRSCYRKSLALAKENGIKSIAFPLISTGSFGYPKEEGMRIAVDEINAFLLGNDMDVYLVVFGNKATRLGEKLYSNLEEYIDQNYVASHWEGEYGGSFSRTAAAYGEGDDEPRSRAARRESVPDEERSRSRAAHVEIEPINDDPTLPLLDMASASGDEMFECASPTWDEDIDVGELLSNDGVLGDALLDDVEELERKLKERMGHVSDTFSEYLMYLIRSKNMKNADVYKGAIVDKKIFSKIKNNVNYHPHKLTALCLCIGARLNLDESKDLLARAGYALSPCDKTDIIFSYFIENGIYDMIELDIQLEEHGQPCIIS